MRFLFLIAILLTSFCAFAQEIPSNTKEKSFAVKDTIAIDSVSINSSNFKITDRTGNIINPNTYSIDYGNATLVFNTPPTSDSIKVSYLSLPEFLTKKYYSLNEDDVVQNSKSSKRLFQLNNESTRDRSIIPFDGLETSGSISRAVTVGNNQNAVLNSELDLQITGKLSDKISLRASIQDANIPLQEAGYSQRLDEFDQVFIEIFSDHWNIRAGDVNLKEERSYFARFSKKVQGISLNGTIVNDSSQVSLFGAGALVRGQFAQSKFTGQEGNQGPYKLVGPNGELFVLVISGSETVYVNGLPLKRGENNDYIIDYNAGEIIFNPTYPITSEMRITVEYQFSDRNYSRIIGYTGSEYTTENFQIGGSLYSENDLKNQPLQQNLSEEQIDILKAAGDNPDLMTAPSAVAAAFDENKILYKKELIGGVEVFVFSTDPNDELFQVSFTNVGNNQGNYIISNTTAINRIYEYVAPIAGVPQGNYEPIIRLVAPSKIQVAVVKGAYQPSEKTHMNFELAGSKNDLNLFSGIDDNNNNGLAGKYVASHQLFQNKNGWMTTLKTDSDFVSDNFKTIERLYNVEFNRDWNLENPEGNQLITTNGIQVQKDSIGVIRYDYEHLNFSKSYNGNKHTILSNLRLGKFQIFSRNSFLKSNADSSKSKFTRLFTRSAYSMKKSWVGAKFALEDNQLRNRNTGELAEISQRFKSYEVFTGVGDSTKIYVALGFRHRLNDSIVNNNLTRVNTTNTYSFNSRLINSENTLLSIYGNYRTLNPEENTLEKEQSLNSRVIYNQKLFNQLFTFNTVYETNSGTLPQQEFTFVEVEEGQGIYTWNDYNGNGIQELEEFEIAQFQDQATFIKVLLPNQIFLKTHQTKLSQVITFNPINWKNAEKGITKTLSHFYNQFSYLVDKKVARDDNAFNLNPFKNTEDELGVTLNFKNSIFYNKGKQHYTTIYTYLNNRSKNVFSSGEQEAKIHSHQLNFNHKFLNFWLFNFQANKDETESLSENFSSKNYLIDSYRLLPKISYLLDNNKRFDVFYEFETKENLTSMQEQLKQQRLGASFTLNNKQKLSLTGEFNYYINDFEGNAALPVSFQMLEGLQPGKNYTWNLFVQKKITKFLDLNVTYFGRKASNSNTIHTGNIQLKAFF